MPALPEEFVGPIVQYLTENGELDAALLCGSPLADTSQRKTDELFLPVRVTRKVKVFEEIRQCAVA